jgi:hypothetical protein
MWRSVTLSGVAAAGLAAAATRGDVLFHDDFDGPDLHPRFSFEPPGTPYFFENGRLVVTLTSPGSALVIDTSDLPSQRCLNIIYQIEDDAFAVGTTLGFDLFADSNTLPGMEFMPISVTLSRPFWNRCQYEVVQGDNNTLTVGFWKSTHKDEKCPEWTDLRIDFLPKRNIACPPTNGDQTVQERQQIQVELKNGVPLTETVDEKEVDIVRIEGCQYHKTIAPFTIGANPVKKIKVVKKLPKPPSAGAGAALDGPLTIALDALTIDSEHQGTGEPSLLMEPSILAPGDLLNVLLTTEGPMLQPGVSKLTMGPDVLIHSFDVLSPTQATALIQVDERARHTGHAVSLQTGPDLTALSEFLVHPPDPGLPQPPNAGPALELIAPRTVPENAPFSIDTIISDPDDQWVQGLMVVMEILSTAEVFQGGLFFPETQGGGPVLNSFHVPGLPAGHYKVVAVASDGLAADELADAHVTVCGDVCPVLPPPGLHEGAGAAGNLRVSPDAFGSWSSNGFLPDQYLGDWNDAFDGTEVSFTNGWGLYAPDRGQRQILSENTAWLDVAPDDGSLSIQVLDPVTATDTNADGLADLSHSTVRVLGGPPPQDTDLRIEVINQVDTGLAGDPRAALIQTLAITNLSPNPVCFNLLRQADADLLFDIDASFANDEVGTSTNALRGDRFVFQREVGEPGTALTLSSASALAYVGAKRGCDPDGPGPGPAMGFGTDLEEWNAFGVPAGWANVIAGVPAPDNMVPGTDGASGHPVGCAVVPAEDCHLLLNIPVCLGAGAGTKVTILFTYGDDCPSQGVECEGEPCAGDTNGDGFVNVQDLVNVLLAWNTNDPGADVTGDGVVDVEDLVAVVLAWGACP